MNFRFPPRKYRYTFEALDAEGRTVIEECFVKAAFGPSSNKSGTFTYCDDGDKLVPLAEESKKATTVLVRLYDGCGRLLDLWRFFQTKLDSTFVPSSYDSIDEIYQIEWNVKYEEVKWTNHRNDGSTEPAKAEDFPFAKLVEVELAAARSAHPQNFRSFHEGLGVILEEFEEFKAEVFRKNVDRGTLRKELVQLAAVCRRFSEDLLE